MADAQELPTGGTAAGTPPGNVDAPGSGSASQTALQKRVLYGTIIIVIVMIVGGSYSFRSLEATVRGESQRGSAAVDAARDKLSSAVEACGIRNTDALTRVASELQTAIAGAHQGIIRAAVAQAEETKSAVDSVRVDILKCLAKDAAPAGNSVAVGSRQAAAGQRALELGSKALASGQTDVAMLYFINGLNHDPSRMELVQRLADAALQGGSVELADRAVGVLELATMQVAPDDMSAVLGRIAEIRAKIAPPPVPKLSPDEAVKRVEELSQAYAPERTWNESERIAEGLSALDQLEETIEVSRADIDDPGYSAVIARCDALGDALRRIQAAQPLYQHVISCVALLRATAAEDSPDVARFASVSASAQSVLSQMWGGWDGLPKGMQAALGACPDQIRRAEASMQEKLSAAPNRRATAIIEGALANRSGSRTDQIRRISGAVESAAREAESIVTSGLKFKLLDLIKKARERQADLDIERRAAYQEWALERLNGFMADWNSRKSVSDEEAKGFFSKREIEKIDETLLVPEVARVLGRVMSCMTGELNAKDGSATEYQMASAKKKRMEDF